MTAISLVRVLHIAIGIFAFMVVPVPLLAAKGSKLHVSYGRIYTWAMAALAATGVPLAARGLFFQDSGRQANALFLFLIALLASDNAWMGIRALRSYRGGSSGARVVDVALPSLLLAGSIGLGALGLLRGALLHIFFALLGTALALGQLRDVRRPTKTRTDAILRHIGGMGVSCITTLTAFLVTNARYVFHIGPFNLFVWVAPAVLGSIAIAVAQRMWRARLS